MAIVATLTSALAGTVTVAFTLDAPSVTGRLDVVDPATGIQLGTDSGVSPLTVSGLPQDRELHLTVSGFDVTPDYVGTSNTITISSLSWGDPAKTYIVTDVIPEATAYKLYNAGTDTLISTSQSNMMVDDTVYASESVADDVDYRVDVTVHGTDEAGAEIIERARHNFPTCFVYGRLADVIGDTQFASRVQLVPHLQKAKDRFSCVKPSLHRGAFFHRQAYQFLPGRAGYFGIYLPWDLVVDIISPEYNLHASFVVPKTATAELTSLTLVYRKTGPANA